MKRTLFPVAGISLALCLAAVLATIIESDDSSEEEAALAMALANMEHKVKAADAERLLDIVDDDLSDESARKLAAVLLRINQSPSDEDKLTLTALLSD